MGDHEGTAAPPGSLRRQRDPQGPVQHPQIPDPQEPWAEL